tara:strand:+ start:436 stop:729 length:294 start_codon:yes stop_codon:yes gene_type:complete
MEEGKIEAGKIEVTVDGRIAKVIATVKVGKRTHTIHASEVGSVFHSAEYQTLKKAEAMIEGYRAALNQYGASMDVYLAMLATQREINRLMIIAVAGE